MVTWITRTSVSCYDSLTFVRVLKLYRLCEATKSRRNRTMVRLLALTVEVDKIVAQAFL